MSKPMSFEIKNNTLTITVDVSPEALAAAPASSTGKTKTVVTTGGYNWATGLIGLGFNLTVSKKG